jgi:AraC-like DNA-binding protein
MDFISIVPDESISLIVKNIMVFNHAEKHDQTILPFFADGYPGLMYQETDNGLYVMPHNKKMPTLFLYGQTIQPVELKVEGAYQFLVFQLYPFVLKSLFNLNAKDLNDDCFDLTRLENFDVPLLIEKLNHTAEHEKRIYLLATFLLAVFEFRKELFDYKIQQAIQLIIETNGQLPVKELRGKLNIHERTFERRFITQVGLSPKHFSKIIQFQVSLNQLQANDYSKLSDIVYDNGFADQSHFIRVIKAYTGKTPKHLASR